MSYIFNLINNDKMTANEMKTVTQNNVFERWFWQKFK